jgi:hypothetical protein
VKEFGGAGVDVKVEFEAQAEEDIGSVVVRWYAWISESTEKDGVEFVSQHVNGAFREGDFLTEVFVGAPVEIDELDRTAAFGGDHLNASDRDGGDFFADAVAGDDRDARLGTARAKRDVGHARYVSMGTDCRF